MERNRIPGSFMIGTPHQKYLGDKIKEDKMDGACSTYGVKGGA
jgi:hypothetical protein